MPYNNAGRTCSATLRPRAPHSSSRRPSLSRMAIRDFKSPPLMSSITSRPLSSGGMGRLRGGRAVKLVGTLIAPSFRRHERPVCSLGIRFPRSLQVPSHPSPVTLAPMNCTTRGWLSRHSMRTSLMKRLGAPSSELKSNTLHATRVPCRRAW